MFHNGEAYLVSSRTEEGLPFVPTTFMNLMILGVLAKAQALYPVTIVGFLFMSNHFHMILIAKNPEHCSAFVGYLKQEIAHALNRMLGRRQRTIWKAEYDSPELLDGARFIQELSYLYANPSEAHIVDKVDDYLGVSSWQAFNCDTATEVKLPVLQRTFFKELRFPFAPHSEDAAYLASLTLQAKTSVTLYIDPWAVRDVYLEFKDLTPSELRQKVLTEIHAREEAARKTRQACNKRLLGAQNHRRASMIVEYTPKKHGRKSVCLSSSSATAKVFLTFFRQLVTNGNDVYQRWKDNDYSVPYPPGLFPPHFPRKANALGSVFA